MGHFNKLLHHRIFFSLNIILLVIAMSCTRNVGNMMPVRPVKQVEIKGNSSPDFKKGWQDGCETGMSAGSNTFYKMFYRSNAVDGWKMTRSNDYQTAWNNAFWFCYRYDYFKQKSSIW